METKQSSIEFLLTELDISKLISREKLIMAAEVVRQAKEMHKGEMIEFSKKCLIKSLDLDLRTAYYKIEDYYNETFEK